MAKTICGLRNTTILGFWRYLYLNGPGFLSAELYRNAQQSIE